VKAIAMEFGLKRQGLRPLGDCGRLERVPARTGPTAAGSCPDHRRSAGPDNELLEQVRLLSNLETDDRKLLQIVLMGQPELKERLNDFNLRQLRQRITIRYHLRP